MFTKVTARWNELKAKADSCNTYFKTLDRSVTAIDQMWADFTALSIKGQKADAEKAKKDMKNEINNLVDFMVSDLVRNKLVRANRYGIGGDYAHFADNKVALQSFKKAFQYHNPTGDLTPALFELDKMNQSKQRGRVKKTHLFVVHCWVKATNAISNFFRWIWSLIRRPFDMFKAKETVRAECP